MRFPYRGYEVEPSPAQPETAVVYRPVVPFRLTGPRGSFDYFGLLDSGADEVFVTEEMAAQLGLDVDTTNIRIQSAAGEMVVSYGHVTLEFAGWEHNRPRSYVWPAVVGVAPGPWPEAILGHTGFLVFFDVTFLGDDKLVEIVRNARELPRFEARP